MNINWPPEKTIEYNAKNPTREDGLVINVEPGVRTRTPRRKGENEIGDKN